MLFSFERPRVHVCADGLAGCICPVGKGGEWNRACFWSCLFSLFFIDAHGKGKTWIYLSFQLAIKW